MRGLILLLALPLAAQELTVRGPEPDYVPVGGRAILRLSVPGIRTDFQLGTLPEIEGIEISSRAPEAVTVEAELLGVRVPRTETSIEIELRPKREGTFPLPPFQADLGGKVLSSMPLELHCIRDEVGAAQAFIELSSPEPRVFLGSIVTVRLRFGVEREFLANNLLQAFQRRLDVPVHVYAGFRSGIPGTALVPDRSAGALSRPKGLSIALDDGVGDVVRVDDATRGGREFAMFELTRRARAGQPGVIRIPEPMLRFAFATRFDEDFVNGRIPKDRTESAVGSDALEIEVLPLPEAGRPEDFSGAVVEEMTLRTEAVVRGSDPNLPLAFVVTIEGEGHLGGFDVPRFESLSDFHVNGVIDDLVGERRVLTYELTRLRSDVDRIPSISLGYFDPRPPGAYRTATAPPIRLAGPTSSEAATAVSEPPGAGLLPMTKGADRARTATPRVRALLLFVVALAVATVALVAKRARERAQNDPLGTRARQALRKFRRAVRTAGASRRKPLAGFLAARLRIPDAAVISLTLGPALIAEGVPRPLAGRAVELLAGLLAADYGGPLVVDSDSRSEEVAREIDEVFRGRERPR